MPEQSGPGAKAGRLRRALGGCLHPRTDAQGFQIALVVLVLLGGSLGMPSPTRAVGTVPAASYKLEATVNLEAATVTVTESVQVRNQVGVPLDSLVFRIAANTLGAFKLSSATVDGQPVTEKLDGSMLELPLARPLAPGARVQADLRYSLKVPSVPDRLSSGPRGMTLGYWFPILTVHRGEWDRRQFVDTGDTSFSEASDFDLTVTTTTAAQIVSSGQRTEQDGRRSRFVASSLRDAALAISPEYTVRRSQVGGVTLEAATFGEDRAAFYLSRGAEFLRWAGSKLTPYPYPTLSLVDADLPASYGGLEYPSLVMLSRGIPLAARPEGQPLDSLLLHEMLHQWFYSLVGNDQIDEPWLDEALVVYVTYLYYRETAPELASGVYQQTIAGGPPGYVDTTVYDYPSDAPYFNVVYRRGARFLEALHDRLGDAAFWALLREHVETHRDHVATSRAFLDRAVAVGGPSLRPLVSEHFDYAAFSPSGARTWTLDAPGGTWSGSVPIFVGADFPVTRVQVWLDSRKLADGPANALTLDLADVDPGAYVLLVRVWDHEDTLYERTRRVEVAW